MGADLSHCGSADLLEHGEKNQFSQCVAHIAHTTPTPCSTKEKKKSAPKYKTNKK
jgi:hypothetical protein